MVPAIFGIAGERLDAEERAFFADCDPAGYILFKRNCASRDQLRALTDELCAIHGRERTFISIDQEGGRVARMKPPEWLAWPNGEVFAALYAKAPASAIQAARSNAAALGAELAECGVTVDYHPLLDLRLPETTDAIGDRALGADPMQVAALGRAILEGLASAGVTGCIKHMPGHGRAQVDSHKELPVVSANEAMLEADIAPFRTLSAAPMGMTAHIRYTAWDAERPATQSPFVIGEIIRKRIGFDGLLLSDDLDMEALDGTVPERARRAVEAGCDIALNCWAKMEDMVGIARELPAMSEETTRRLETALAHAAPPESLPDIGEMVARRDELFAAAGLEGPVPA